MIYVVLLIVGPHESRACVLMLYHCISPTKLCIYPHAEKHVSSCYIIDIINKMLYLSSRRKTWERMHVKTYSYKYSCVWSCTTLYLTPQYVLHEIRWEYNTCSNPLSYCIKSICPVNKIPIVWNIQTSEWKQSLSLNLIWLLSFYSLSVIHRWYMLSSLSSVLTNCVHVSSCYIII